MHITTPPPPIQLSSDIHEPIFKCSFTNIFWLLNSTSNSVASHSIKAKLYRYKVVLDEILGVRKLLTGNGI